MIIGLTGQIGAGKTTVASVFKKLGAVIIDADQIGREILVKARSVRRSLIESFGDSIVTISGEIDRSTLAAKAFQSEKSRRTLNRIVHPYLLRELGRQVRLAQKEGRTVVIDAALLLEWKLDTRVDLVVVVAAPREARIKRMVSRGLTRADVMRRMRRQMSSAEFAKRADVLITNAGTQADLDRAARFCYRQIVLPKRNR